MLVANLLSSLAIERCLSGVMLETGLILCFLIFLCL
jgi:hypothetical protein